MTVDANGNSIEVFISDATIHDVKVSPDLILKLDLNSTKTLCADKGYDTESLREQIQKPKTHANIPREFNT